MALLVREVMTQNICQPWMGLELHRRMYDVGLEQRAIIPVVDDALIYTEIVRRHGFDPRAAVEVLAAEGREEQQFRAANPS